MVVNFTSRENHKPATSHLDKLYDITYQVHLAIQTIITQLYHPLSFAATRYL
jgi:hypothetical protein